MVFYRKYRPQTIAELDKEDVRTQLTSILSREDMPHAFLFTGPKGTGKTSSARIIAKIVNCEKRSKKSIEPCNTCTQCVSVMQGSHVDVVEIDAASNRGIDEIRELREKITFTPAMGRKKIYIIDEVHMLTREAFNALLKTLEEPPAHVLFILATTEVHKLPDTIVSRCTEVNFTRATSDEIKRSIGRIAKDENKVLDKSVVTAVVRQSDGSFRDAAKLYEQVLTGGKGVVDSMASSHKSAQDILTALVAYDTHTCLEIVSTLSAHGADFTEFIKGAIALLHDELLSRYTTSGSSDNMKTLSIHHIQALTKLFIRAYQETKISPIEELPLELVVIEWCGSKDGKDK